MSSETVNLVRETTTEKQIVIHDRFHFLTQRLKLDGCSHSQRLQVIQTCFLQFTPAHQIYEILRETSGRVAEDCRKLTDYQVEKVERLHLDVGIQTDELGTCALTGVTVTSRTENYYHGSWLIIYIVQVQCQRHRSDVLLNRSHLRW